MTVHVVTDSTSDIPPEVAKELGIVIVPLHIHFGEETYEDGVTISKDEFYDFFTPRNRDKPEIHGGFAMSHFSGDADIEETIKKDLNVTVRCIPFDGEMEEGNCVISGRASTQRVIFAKAY